MRWLEDVTDSVDMNLGKFWEMVGTEKSRMLQSVRLQRVGHDWVTEQQLENLTSGVSISNLYRQCAG